MTTMRTALVHGVVLAMGFLSTEIIAAGRAINPQDYPKLTDKQLGQIRHLVKLSNNLPGDWAGFESLLLPTERSYQFHVSFAGMALALAQHQYTPAYRELYKSAIESLIAKLQHPDIWTRWVLASRSGALDGITKDIDGGWIDPVAKDNIMLKAYLLQLGAAHAMLYGDHKYDQPGAFTFKFHENGFGNGNVTFRYTLSDIAKITYQEYVDSGYVGAACEPGRIFPSCNSISNVGFMHYDATHGTHYADILPKVKATWIDKGFINPETYRQALVINTAWSDRSAEQEGRMFIPMNFALGAWAATFNNAWDQKFVRAMYYGADRDRTLHHFLSGDYSRTTWSNKAGAEAGASMLWGQFLTLAAEVGDNKAVDMMLAYAERNFNPVWQNGEYFYPRNDDYSVDAQGNSHGVDNFTGNELILIARLIGGRGGGGFYRLYNQPWDEEQYKQPYVSDVDTLTAGVTQAFYDGSKRALIVTLVPGPVAAKQVQFAVRQLDPAKGYSVTKDGKSVGSLDRKTSHRWMTWREDGSVLISTGIAAPHTFVFLAD